MSFIRQVFLKGLLAILPIAATIYIAVWFVSGFESLFSPGLRKLLPEGAYLPGMGVALGLIVIFLIGLMLEALLARKLWSFGEVLLSRMPLVSQLYEALKQAISYVSGAERAAGKSVVLVDLGAGKARLLGLVTQESLDFLPENDLIAVFLPWSYQIGGITLLVSRDAVEPVNLTPQEALRFSLTAGVRKEEGLTGAA